MTDKILTMDEWESQPTRASKLVDIAKAVVNSWENEKLKRSGARVKYNPNVHMIYFHANAKRPIFSWVSDPSDIEIDIVDNSIFPNEHYLALGCAISSAYRRELNENFQVIDTS